MERYWHEKGMDQRTCDEPNVVSTLEVCVHQLSFCQEHKQDTQTHEYHDTWSVPPLTTEDIMWGQPSCRIWEMVAKIDGLVNCHWPQLRISLIRPVNSTVEKHRASTGHHILNGLLSNAIPMVSSNSGIATCLSKLSQMVSILGTCKTFGVI